MQISYSAYFYNFSERAYQYHSRDTLLMKTELFPAGEPKAMLFKYIKNMV